MIPLRHSRKLIVPSIGALLLACSPKDDTEVSQTSSAQDSDPGTESGTSTSDSDAWPNCQPVVFPRYGFRDPEIPDGKLLSASCVFRSLTPVERGPEPSQIQLPSWAHTLVVSDCVDSQGEPTDDPLGAVFVTGEAVALPLADGDMIEVQAGRESVGDFSFAFWYSIRRAENGELVFAAFGDLGPTLAPKLAKQPPLSGWLAPLEVELGPFACAVDNATACAMPQRAVAHFRMNGQTTDILGGTIADVGRYRVHLGYAGAVDVCEGSPTNMPIEGLVFALPS